jgi:hypothetical protein
MPRLGGVWINERFPSALMTAAAVTAYALERRDADDDPAPLTPPGSSRATTPAG